jgi:hypothetical protein
MTDRDMLRQEPEPDMVLIRAERRETPEALAALGLVRVRIKMRSGAWRYDAVPAEALVESIPGA